jgi:hypothetical protein
VRNEAPFLLTAVLLHAAVLGAYFVVPHTPVGEDLRASALRVIEIERIETETKTETETPLPKATSPDLTPPSPEAPAARATAPTSREPSSIPTAAPGLEATATPAVPGPKKDEYDGPVDDGRGILGLPGPSGVGGLAIWSIPNVIPSAAPPAPAPTTGARPRPIDKDIAGIVVRDAMHESDKHLGLDLPAAGTVATAIREVVRGSDTPDEARASFEVRLGADGKVIGVKVSSFSGGSAGAWERAAQAAIASLRGRALVMNQTFAKGGTIYVDVTSAVMLPDGTKSGIHRQGLGASFDVANIGAHVQRVVKTSFRSVAMR